MTGSVVEQLVPTPLEMNSSSSEATDFEAQRIGVASAVALLSGITMVKQMWQTLKVMCYCLFKLLPDIPKVNVLCCSSVCSAFSSAFSPPICQSQLSRLLPALLRFMSPSHSCKACWGCGFLATLGLSPSLRYATKSCCSI